MKKAIRFFAMALMLVGMFGLTSCSKTEKLIIGTWQVTNAEGEDIDAESLVYMKMISFTFNDDNTMSYGIKDVYEMSGTYEIDDDVLIFTMDAIDDEDTELSKLLIKSISKKELCLGDATGESDFVITLTKQ